MIYIYFGLEQGWVKGSTIIRTQKDGRILRGELITNKNPGAQYLFSGKEKQDHLFALDWYDSGARFQTADGIFTGIDPLAEKYYHISPYAYCAGNPMNITDPTGKEVRVVFDKTTRRLYITDLDHYMRGLPTRYVSANDYVMGGIRDKNGKIIYNQVLVIERAFSGGRIHNGMVVREADNPYQKALSNATYDILNNKADTNHPDWFRLDRQDKRRFNDRDDVSNRDGFRFHLGTISHGCITVDRTQKDVNTIWNVVLSIFNSTSTTIVPEKRGHQWLNPFSRLVKYGTLEVQGEDTIPLKREED